MITKFRYLKSAPKLISVSSRCFSSERKTHLIETEELAEIMDKSPKNLRILNGTWYMPGVQIFPREEHKKSRIPNSVFFDIDEISDKSTNLPHMLPPLDQFIVMMKYMRVRRTDHIVCYDDVGIFSSPRVAWTMKFFGAKNVQVLNGGLKKWKKEGRPTQSGEENIEALEKEGDYDYRIVDPSKVISKTKDVHDLAYYVYNDATNTQIIDARPPARFNGEVEEPRKGLRKGHIAGSKNIFFQTLIDKETGTLKPDRELAKIFLEKGIDTTHATVTSCGSGLSACILNLALEIMGNDKVVLYDGSWSQYGAEPEPDFNTGNWETPINDLLQKTIKTDPELFKKFQTQVEFYRGLRERGDRLNDLNDELRKKYPKHLYDSDAEQSDYELNDEELHPKIKK